ncbi:MAG: phosphate starvation-inducible protein PhoH, partial [Bacteroidia bacterium]|nr:phosphate starvation-inducible protein PhoH [Bacteroidia bacterium]
MSEIVLKIDGIDPLELYGERNSKLNLIKKAYPELLITSRGENLKISGKKKDAQSAKAKVEQLVKIVRSNNPLSIQKVKDVLNGNLTYELEQDQKDARDGSVNANVIVYGRNARPIKA